MADSPNLICNKKRRSNFDILELENKYSVLNSKFPRNNKQQIQLKQTPTNDRPKRAAAAEAKKEINKINLDNNEDSDREEYDSEDEYNSCDEESESKSEPESKSGSQDFDNSDDDYYEGAKKVKRRIQQINNVNSILPKRAAALMAKTNIKKIQKQGYYDDEEPSVFYDSRNIYAARRRQILNTYNNNISEKVKELEKEVKEEKVEEKEGKEEKEKVEYINIKCEIFNRSNMLIKEITAKIGKRTSFTKLISKIIAITGMELSNLDFTYNNTILNLDLKPRDIDYKNNNIIIKAKIK